VRGRCQGAAHLLSRQDARRGPTQGLAGHARGAGDAAIVAGADGVPGVEGTLLHEVGVRPSGETPALMVSPRRMRMSRSGERNDRVPEPGRSRPRRSGAAGKDRRAAAARLPRPARPESAARARRNLWRTAGASVVVRRRQGRLQPGERCRLGGAPRRRCDWGAAGLPSPSTSFRTGETSGCCRRGSCTTSYGCSRGNERPETRP
jgi:hypothetical protein